MPSQRVVYREIQETLETYYGGIPVSCLSWLDSSYQLKFNKSLDYNKSLGVKNIEELIVKMRDKRMVLFSEEPQSKVTYVMSTRMVENRQKVSLKLNVQELLDMHCGEILFSSFEDLYKEKFMVKPNYFLYGLTDLDHLCEVLKDILVVEASNSSRKKVIKDARIFSREKVIKAGKIYNLRKRKK